MQAEFRRFATSTKPGVLCIKGKWGVGKTYAWKEFLNGLDKGGVSFKRYAYVSLFGLNTMDQVRSAIVETAQTPDQIGKKVDLDNLASEPRGAADRAWRRALSYVDLVPSQRLKDLAAVFQAASFLAVSDYLVCIDDLERKGSGLQIKDVLGLISYMSEQRQCKIVLILNEDAFPDPEKQEFKRFFEKTIDSHLVFSPTPQECIDIAMPPGNELNDALRPHCLALEISNIRVLKKIERLGAILQSQIANAIVRSRALKTVALLGWAKYSEEAAPLSFLKLRGRDYSRELGERSADEQKWGPLLNTYGFRHMTDLDDVLSEGVEIGYFDDAKLAPQVASIVADIAANEVDNQYNRAWQRYHNSFDHDAEALGDEMYAAFRDNVVHVSPMNANSTIRLLKDIGRVQQATELIQFYLDQRGVAILDRTHHFQENDIDEPEFLAAFEARAAAIVDDREPASVLEAIASKNSWDRKDVALLASLTADDYFAMFKGINGEKLSPMIRRALEFGGNPQENAIRTAVTEALQRIGAENPLNRRRVQKFGVKVV